MHIISVEPTSLPNNPHNRSYSVSWKSINSSYLIWLIKQVFYTTHRLYLIFLIGFLLHVPDFWKWLLIPGLLLCVEKLWCSSDVSRSFRYYKSYLTTASLLPNGVSTLRKSIIHILRNVIQSAYFSGWNFQNFPNEIICTFSVNSRVHRVQQFMSRYFSRILEKEHEAEEVFVFQKNCVSVFCFV